MTQYRAFLIGTDGHFKGTQNFESDCDARALESARQFAKEQPVEVWQEARKIGVVEIQAG